VNTFNKYYNSLHSNIKTYFQILLKGEEFPDFLKPYIKTKGMQRLKGRSYFCGMEGAKNIYSFKYYYSRLDHSIATALIIWNFTHNKTMTLSALLHDYTTPANSHVIDYMNDDYIKQESTERDICAQLYKDQDILELLKEDGVTPEEISDPKKFSLVDNERPKLCADRIDGIFSPCYIWLKNITFPEIFSIYNNIAVTKNKTEFGFKTKEYAEKMIYFNQKVADATESPSDIFCMNLKANIIKRAINLGIITYDDLFEVDTEKEIDQIIANSDDLELQDMQSTFENVSHVESSANSIIVKKRTLNPMVVTSRGETRINTTQLDVKTKKYTCENL